MKSIMLPTLIFASVLVIAASGVIHLLSPAGEWDFRPYGGPYPAELPAGHCLITDGKYFSTRGVQYREKAKRSLGSKCETPGDAIEFAWIMREVWRHDYYTPPPPSKEDWKPVNPELCKADK